VCKQDGRFGHNTLTLLQDINMKSIKEEFKGSIASMERAWLRRTLIVATVLPILVIFLITHISRGIAEYIDKISRAW